MNVLVLHSELGVLRGGGENFTRRLFPAFVNRGHRVSVAFVADGRGNYPFALPPEVEPIPIKGWWAKNLGQATFSTIARQLPDQGQFKNFWRRCQEALNGRTFRWHNRRFQRRIEREFKGRWLDFHAVYVHGDTPLAYMASERRPTILRLPGPVGSELAPILNKVHGVCANGDALVRIRGFLGNHATELPIGIDLENFRPGPSSVRTTLKWPKNAFVIGYVGRLTKLKGVDILAHAFRDIARHMPEARLLIVGSGEEETSLRNHLAKDISQCVAHIEHDVSHAQLANWYRAMDLFVMPSRYENFSNAIVESMACGVPFFASNVGGNKIIAETGAGWLFESESISSFTNGVENIFKSAAELRARKEIGIAYVRKQHSWSAVAENLEKIIRSRLGIS